ncbi:hypothetical protein [Nonomuraea endophytica]|uniref:Uncharacterized protein n=1 Tax=Nonomuraea endophytica TaxID=714136 RepID=A0A7W8EGR7_9ACTN|nr:hypothetical protein [Nonomuraea endophytica]MBB5078864.1 hypothetical protein [Nonomuraea endophytica]
MEIILGALAVCAIFVALLGSILVATIKEEDRIRKLPARPASTMIKFTRWISGLHIRDGGQE